MNIDVPYMVAAVSGMNNFISYTVVCEVAILFVMVIVVSHFYYKKTQKSGFRKNSKLLIFTAVTGAPLSFFIIPPVIYSLYSPAVADSDLVTVMEDSQCMSEIIKERYSHRKSVITYYDIHKVNETCEDQDYISRQRQDDILNR